MVKTPKTRHSKSHRQPVTIELQPDEVARVTDPEKPQQAGPDTHPEDFDAAEASAAAAGPAEETTDADRGRSYGFDELPPRPGNDGTDEDTREEPPPSSAGAERGGMSPVLAGLAGAILALAGAGALQYAGLLGAPGSRLADGVNTQLSALKTQVAALSNSETGGDAMARIKILSDGLDQAKTDVADLKTALGLQAGDAQALGDLREKVAALQSTVDAMANADRAPAAELAALDEKIAALDALAKSAADAAGQRQNRLAALEQSLSQLSTRVEAQASQPKIALSIAASALKTALDRGAPFSAELETFAAIAPDAPQLAALRPYAEKGVPTRADIAAATGAASDAMVAAATPADTDAGFLQSLMASAEKLVKVRPVGAVEGAGVPETVARFEAAVRQGDYAKALAEYDMLPESVRAAGADLAGKLKARLDVEAQMDALIADAMKA